MSTVEVELVTIHIKLNLGGFVNCMLWKHTGRTRFDSMIGPFMTRVCSGLKVPHTLLQVETEEGPDPPLPQQYAYLPAEVQTYGKGHFLLGLPWKGCLD